jgi:hypothetical protein
MFISVPSYDWPGVVHSRAARHGYAGKPIKITDFVKFANCSNYLLQFDFNLNARGQIEFHQRVNRFVGWIYDIHQALMRANLELISRSLVDVWTAQNVVTLDSGGQWNGAVHHSTRALGRINDFGRRLIDQSVVEGLQANPNFLTLHHTSSKNN